MKDTVFHIVVTLFFLSLTAILSGVAVAVWRWALYGDVCP